LKLGRAEKKGGLFMAEETLAEVMKRLDEMERRLTVAEDIEQIKQLTIRYITGHTLNDGALEAEGFADDATFDRDGQMTVGKEAIAKFTVNHAEALKASTPFTGAYQLPKVPTDGHFIVHPVISVDGDRAEGTWMQYCLSAEPVTMHIVYYVQALYDIEYVKRNGKWQFHSVKWTPRIQPRGEVQSLF
jgi:hypothetical protein